MEDGRHSTDGTSDNVIDNNEASIENTQNSVGTLEIVFVFVIGMERKSVLAINIVCTRTLENIEMSVARSLRLLLP